MPCAIVLPVATQVRHTSGVSAVLPLVLHISASDELFKLLSSSICTSSDGPSGKRVSLDAGMLSRAFPPLSHQGGTASSSRCTVAQAQGRRRSADDDVDLDDEEYYDEEQASLAALRRSCAPFPSRSCLVTGIPPCPHLSSSALSQQVSRTSQTEQLLPAGLWRDHCAQAGMGRCGQSDRAPGRCGVRLCPGVCLSPHSEFRFSSCFAAVLGDGE